MNEIFRVFIINLVSDIDNMLILGTVLRRYSYINITLPAVILLTLTRTLYVSVIEGLSNFPMFHLLVGIILIFISFKLVTRSIKDEKWTRFPDTIFLKLRVLLVLAVTDFLICMDSVIVIYEFSTKMTSVVFGIFISLLISLHFLPLFEKLAANFFWINVIAGGFIAQNAVLVIAKDPIVDRWMHYFRLKDTDTNMINIAANGAVGLIIVTGIISYIRQRRMQL